ncbi:MAG: arylesterase [Thermoanaerobaculia bacterium]|nr:arylesterase [Thermoanaerobaculia bacterium]
MSTARASRQRAAAPPPRDTRRYAVIAVLIALAAVFAWRWTSSPKIRNLDSRGTTIVAFGDSLTAGVGAGPGEDYPARLAALAGVTIVNAGVSGDTTESALARIEQDALAQNPRIVIVGLGGNDFLRRAAIGDTEANLRRIVRQIHGAGAVVVLLGFRFPTIGPSYEAMYEGIASDESCLLVPDLLDGILSDPSMHSDDIHPNGRGYALMAERIAGPLRKVISRADRSR